jgi:hypothetical protein
LRAEEKNGASRLEAPIRERSRRVRCRAPGDGGNVDGLPTISGFASDLDIWFLAEQVAQSIPDDGSRRFPSWSGWVGDAVADAGRGGDDGRVAELAAQPPDGDGDRVGERVGLLVPDALQ